MKKIKHISNRSHGIEGGEKPKTAEEETSIIAQLMPKPRKALALKSDEEEAVVSSSSPGQTQRRLGIIWFRRREREVELMVF